VAFILYKIFGKGTDVPGVNILVVANVVSALLFAASHLPATAILFGLTPLIVFRCFLLNGGIGILLGWLYQKYGLRYSMIAHAGAHVVSKLIWILFI
jgi:membrane protease YdiL (CAAX protease family)